MSTAPLAKAKRSVAARVSEPRFLRSAASPLASWDYKRNAPHLAPTPLSLFESIGAHEVVASLHPKPSRPTPATNK
jgi:hypothetical protein